VTGINIVSPGSGYSSTPTISFEPADGDYGIVWRNDGATGAGEPITAVGLSVVKGLFSARLGDTAFPNMAAIADSVFLKAPLRLRVWFNDGVKGSQQFGQDTPITGASIAYNSLFTKTIVINQFFANGYSSLFSGGLPASLTVGYSYDYNFILTKFFEYPVSKFKTIKFRRVINGRVNGVVPIRSFGLYLKSRDLYSGNDRTEYSYEIPPSSFSATDDATILQNLGIVCDPTRSYFLQYVVDASVTYNTSITLFPIILETE
jgi:hypothetical protein